MSTDGLMHFLTPFGLGFFSVSNLLYSLLVDSYTTSRYTRFVGKYVYTRFVGKL